jgi:hypothetical protein
LFNLREISKRVKIFYSCWLLVAGSWPPEEKAGRHKQPATSNQPQGLQWLRFVDKHDRNIVFNVIFQAAINANELLLLFAIFQFALALRARQNLEQFLIEHKKPPTINNVMVYD